MKKLVITLIVWATLTHTIANAQQSTTYDTRLYTMNDGLPEQGVNAAIQDSKRLIWVATYSGLSRFDGYTFKTYHSIPNSDNSLSNEMVHSIVEDSLGRLWIGSSGGVDVLDTKTDKFILHWPDTVGDIMVSKIRKKQDGHLWICSANGLYVANPLTFRFTKYNAIPYAMDIDETPNGLVIAASGGGGLIVHDPRKNETTHLLNEVTDDPKVLKNQFCWTVKVDRQDRIWVGRDGQLALFDAEAKTFKSYSVTGTLSIHDREDGQLMLGTRHGMSLFNPKLGTADSVTKDTHVMSVIGDNQGGFWASSLLGLRHIYAARKSFKTVTTAGLSVGSIVEDIKHNVWAVIAKDANTSARLVKFPGGFSQRALSVQGDGVLVEDVISDSVLNVFTGDAGRRIWVAMPNQYISIDAESGRSEMIKAKIDLPLTGMCDSRGRLWINNWSDVSVFDPKSRIGKCVIPSIGLVYAFLEDSDHNIWIAAHAGLARYNLDTEKLDIFTNNPGDPTSISSNNVFHVMIDKDSNIWVGTSGGLNRIVRGTEHGVPKFESWSNDQSRLPNNNVYSVVDGGDGSIWLTGGNQISHFLVSQNTFLNYGAAHGVTAQNFRGFFYLNGKSLKSHSGHVIFGSNDGLTIFHPDSVDHNDFVPPVVVHTLYVASQNKLENAKVDNAFSTDRLRVRSIVDTQDIRLEHDENDFNLEFSALNYRHPERNQYRYRLEPFQKTWITTTAADRTARYTNMSPGKYVFMVQGSNNDGVWNEKSSSIAITILPPWWQTWWSYVAYGAIVVMMLFIFRRWTIQRESLKNELAVETLRATKAKEVEKIKTDFFVNMSHELRTPLTLIQGPLRDLYRGSFVGDKKALIQMMIRNSERLSNLINQILDLGKIDAGKMPLQNSVQDVVTFLGDIVSTYQTTTISKQIALRFNSKVIDLIACTDFNKLDKVINNLVSNALKFTSEGGEVTLSLDVKSDIMLISVRDTGIGIPADQLDKVFDRFHQVDTPSRRNKEGSGVGLALAKELTNLLDGKIEVSSKEHLGTTFTVTIPVRNPLTPESSIDMLLRSSANQFEQVKVALPTSGQKQLKGDEAVVLVIEDNEDTRRYIADFLKDDYHILNSSDGIVGLKLAMECLPDLIISDVMMPGMDGYNLCTSIKTSEVTSHIPVILLTAKGDHDSRLEGLGHMADNYLSKPFDSVELKLIIRNVLDMRRKMQDRYSRQVTLEPRQVQITSLDERFLAKVMSIIEEHMHEESFSIEELSAHAGYSNMQLYRKIKALTTQTPSVFLRTVRLKRAAEMLKKNADNVSQVAYSVGFSSLSYFNKCFKEQFGTTPGTFAEKQLHDQ